MAQPRQILTLVVAACIAAQASGRGAHPEVIRFFRQPVAHVLDEEAGLGQTSSRKLQQTFESPDRELPTVIDTSQSTAIAVTASGLITRITAAAVTGCVQPKAAVAAAVAVPAAQSVNMSYF